MMKWLPVLIVITLLACQRVDPLTSNADEYLKANLEEVDGYKFISMHKHDSFTYRRMLTPVVKKTIDDTIQHALMRLYASGPVDSVLDYVYLVKYNARQGETVKPQQTYLLISPDGTVRNMENDYAVMLLNYYQSSRLNDLPGYKEAYIK